MCLKNMCTLVESTGVHIPADSSVYGQAIIRLLQNIIYL